jgi:molybdopterin converting factor small subunit
MDVVEVNLPQGSRSDDVSDALKDHLSSDAIAAVNADEVKIAVNQVILRADQNLNEGDEVAFMPPITGG